MIDQCVILVIGQAGAGKSEFGNVYLRNPEAFVTNDSTDSVTIETHAEHQTIDGVIRWYIDTQGFDDTQGVDSAHVQQMVQFLRSWNRGVNAVAILINGQHPRLDAGTQKLIKIIHTFFNNPEFWDHVCLVFTRDFEENPVNRKRVEGEYRSKVQDIVMKCMDNQAFRPLLPVFIVNSKRFNDQKTRDELAAFHAFAIGLSAISTERVVTPSIRFMKIEIERKKGVLTDEKIGVENANTRVKTLIYEDEQREKRIAYDGKTVNFSEWTRIPNTREVKRLYEKTVVEQKTVLFKETKTEEYKKVELLMHKYRFFGPKIRRYKFDHYDVVKEYQNMERKVITNFDGSISYGDWKVTGTFTKKEILPG
jgi:hypothetical protein